MPRLFLGLALPDATRDHLLDWREAIDGARWQGRDQLHLTLCFLGQVAPDRVPGLFRALDGLTGQAFFVEPAGVGCFGDPRQPRNLWAGVSPEEPLRALHGELCKRLDAGGFPIEARRFHPHITLARFGRRPPGPARRFLERYHDHRGPGFEVGAVTLFLSETTPAGSHYHSLADFRLQGPR